MILHERRFKPLCWWIALCGALGACQVHENLWNDELDVTVERGSAVSPWQDAQLVTQAEDASADAARPDSGPTDAAVARDAEAVGGERCAFRVTIHALGGEYAPKNIVAIWIERGDGSWVKTLAVWAGVRLRYLTAYRAANTTGNKVDAVTSGTLPAFGSHSVGWNLSDAEGNEVPDGEYRVRVEVTDHDGAGETLTVPFMKAEPPFVSSLADAEYFSDVALRCR